MCSPVQCSTCKKITWSGCGQHIEEALAGFAKNEICTCEIVEGERAGFFSRLFGKG